MRTPARSLAWLHATLREMPRRFNAVASRSDVERRHRLRAAHIADCVAAQSPGRVFVCGLSPTVDAVSRARGSARGTECDPHGAVRRVMGTR